jgi:transcriptional regulator with XRE-family HTH domain
MAKDSFAQMIRRRREAAGLTLADVSAATGIAVPNLSRIESGRSAIRSDTLERIARAL